MLALHPYARTVRLLWVVERANVMAGAVDKRCGAGMWFRLANDGKLISSQQSDTKSPDLANTTVHFFPKSQSPVHDCTMLSRAKLVYRRHTCFHMVTCGLPTKYWSAVPTAAI